MRLVCPNCDAEYEVDDAAIPRAGRDVQCSNCGHAWFQTHPEVAGEQADTAAAFDRDEVGPEAVVTAEAEAEPVSEPVAEADAAQPVAEAVEVPEAVAAVPDDMAAAVSAVVADDSGDTSPMVAEAAQPASRQIDNSVLAVLREEAEREASARRAEVPNLETQTEMGLDPVADAAARRGQRLQGEVAPDAVRPKRELLPTIEEINSTLRSSSGRTETDADDPGNLLPAEPEPTPRGGFGRGFLTLVLLAAILVALYVFAPLIGAKVPALAGGMAGYVTVVDATRLWLDTEIRALIATLRGFEGSSQG